MSCPTCHGRGTTTCCRDLFASQQAVCPCRGEPQPCPDCPCAECGQPLTAEDLAEGADLCVGCSAEPEPEPEVNNEPALPSWMERLEEDL